MAKREWTTAELQLIAIFAPSGAGAPSAATAKIVGAFLRKHSAYHLANDLHSAAYVAVCKNVERAAKVANPCGYLAVTMRSAMIDVLRSDSMISYPYHAKLKKLPRHNRIVPTKQVHEYTDQPALRDVPDRSHLNGQLGEMTEALTARDAELAKLLTDGWTVQEIAAKQKVPPQTIYARRRRMRTRLRAAASEAEGELSGLSALAVEVLRAVVDERPKLDSQDEA